MRGEGDVIKLPGEEKRGEENKGERRGSVGPVTKALTNLTATASCSRFDGRLEKTDRLGWKERTVVPLVDRRGHSSQTFFHMRSRSPAEQPVEAAAVLSDRTAFARRRRRGTATAAPIIIASVRPSLLVPPSGHLNRNAKYAIKRTDRRADARTDGHGRTGAGGEGGKRKTDDEATCASPIAQPHVTGLLFTPLPSLSPYV